MNQELIDKHREINVDGDWWFEAVYEWFEERCHEVGVNILTTYRHMGNGKSKLDKDITWSGFWSQGDGAAFSGSVVDLEKAVVDFANRYPITYKYVVDLNGYFKYWWKIGSHNNITLGDLDTEDITYYVEDDHPLAEVWQEELYKELELLEPELSDLASDLCKVLYDALRDEYDALTTDEAVWETIVANELDKEIDDVE
jgi:hypothetical protein